MVRRSFRPGWGLHSGNVGPRVPLRSTRGYWRCARRAGWELACPRQLYVPSIALRALDNSACPRQLCVPSTTLRALDSSERVPHPVASARGGGLKAAERHPKSRVVRRPSVPHPTLRLWSGAPAQGAGLKNTERHAPPPEPSGDHPARCSGGTPRRFPARKAGVTWLAPGGGVSRNPGTWSSRKTSPSGTKRRISVDSRFVLVGRRTHALN